MKYALFYQQTKDIVEYTISVLRALIKKYGHTETTPNDADVILISVCDINQILFVEKIRKQYSDKKICVGGHAAIYWKLFSLFADYINIGQGFEFFKAQTLQEIESLPCVWVNGKKELSSSTLIDWSIVPCANVTTGQYYYWGAVGCKNRCKFCLTSWTNPHQQNDQRRIESIRQKIKNVTIVTNDSDAVGKRMTQSIMLKDFLKANLKKYAVYRLGVEFATEDNRKKYGKPFTDDQFCEMIDRAVKYGVRLKIFCISGIDEYDDWNKLFFKIYPVYVKGHFDLKFTNICYEMFTPIKKERYDLSLDKMFDTERSREFCLKHKTRCWPLAPLPTASKAATVIKNMLIWTANKNEYNIFKTIKNSDDEKLIYDLLMRNKFFENDYSETVKINHAVREME